MVARVTSIVRGGVVAQCKKLGQVDVLVRKRVPHERDEGFMTLFYHLEKLLNSNSK